MPDNMYNTIKLKVGLLLTLVLILLPSTLIASEYERNKAVPVQQVIFGQIESVRNITEKEIVEDKHNGWKTFGGALIGGVIGNQFGSGSGKDVATVLGAMIGAGVADNNQRKAREKVIRLVELMILTESGDQFMVVQGLDSSMLFAKGNEIRMIYLENGTVRIDKQM